MKFSNVVAYCKGWYESRGDVDTMWKDMIHCINVDGWLCTSKRDVAGWCLSQMDNYAKEHPELSYKLSFRVFYSQMEELKTINEFSYKPLKLSDYDYIIWAFRDFVRYLDSNIFTYGVKPSPDVLPLHLMEGYNSPYREWQPSEMREDALKRINRAFPNYEEQIINKEYYSYEKIESRIKENENF